jgi:hypothetical protein
LPALRVFFVVITREIDMPMRSDFDDSDSIAAKFMKAALAKRDASTTMKKKMRTTFRQLEKAARKGRWGNIDPSNLTEKQLKAYIASREGKVTERTVQNEASHIRRALAGAGRAEFVKNKCASKAIGVPAASRIGRGKVVDLSVLDVALGKARADTRAIILLSHAIGLRGREAVMCKESLKEWKRAIAAGQPPYVRYGTKGGRGRSVYLCPEKAAEAAAAVDAALEILKSQENLVDSTNLKAALATNHKRLRKIGLNAENSLHSLRRSFALTQYYYYLETVELTNKVALQRLANDLGHGDGRGRWVYNNYLRGSLNG